MLTLTWLTPHAGNISAGSGRSGSLATHDLFGGEEDTTRVGIMRQAKLAHTPTAAELSHTDLGKLFLETMRA